MGRTKRDYMNSQIWDFMTINGIKMDYWNIQRMKKAEEQWEEINKENTLHWWAWVWKYFHNLHTRKSRKNTLDGTGNGAET